MARLNYDYIQNHPQNNNNSSSNVGFFSLKNDGDRALVRFMYTDTSEFEIFREHVVTNKEGKFKSVNCLRNNDTTDPITKCPFCEGNITRRDRFYIKLLQYTTDTNGNVVVEAKVWDRPVSQAKKLASILSEYGPLTDCLMYIKRSGAKGAKDTTYDYVYAVNENMHQENFPIKPELFDGYNVLGIRVLSKSAEDMNHFMSTGEFPQKARTNDESTKSESNSNDNQTNVEASAHENTPKQSAFVPEFSQRQFDPNIFQQNPFSSATQSTQFTPVTPNTNRTY